VALEPSKGPLDRGWEALGVLLGALGRLWASSWAMLQVNIDA